MNHFSEIFFHIPKDTIGHPEYLPRRQVFWIFQPAKKSACNSGQNKKYMQLKKFLQSGIVLCALLFTNMATAQQSREAAVLKYIAGLQKPEGGYGWADQPDGHITPTYACVGTLNHLGNLPSDRKSLINWIETHHPQTGVNQEAGPSGAQMRDLTYHQVMAISWLGGSTASFKEEVSRWKSQRGALANYENNRFANLWQETFTPICRQLLGLDLQQTTIDFTGYLDSLRRANGSYNNAPVSFKEPGDGNMLNTLHSVIALQSLGQAVPGKEQLIRWIEKCRTISGGFTHQPEPELAKKPDIIYTWAAIKLLKLLGATPGNGASVRYILSLQNWDGGFGSKPGLASTPLSTFYAVEALHLAGAGNALKEPLRSFAAIRSEEPLKGQKVFSVQFQSVGNGSPAEAVMLADSLNIHLWGAKNAPSGWVKVAQAIADKKGVPVHFFICDEPYNKNILVPGMGSFGHILDYYAPAGNPVEFPAESIWPSLSEQYFKRLIHQDGGLILQVSNNEPLARILLDESIDNGGYTAMATHHFDQNFAFWLPYLFDYRDRLPMVCLQDGHGTESWWWGDDLLKERTLFIASEPTYEGMIAAMKKNHIVSVKHDSITSNKVRMMGGTDAARKFIMAAQQQWKWWNDTGENKDHPWAAVTILKPGDLFETGTSSEGIVVRVRCWYKTRQQTILQPVTELVQLKIDGKTVTTTFLKKENQRKQLQDIYHTYKAGQLSKGTHTIEVLVRKISTGEIRIIKTQFYVE
ncbi:MAG: terpene cyclase/mutase family protein [Niabella sp.]